MAIAAIRGFLGVCSHFSKKSQNGQNEKDGKISKNEKDRKISKWGKGDHIGITVIGFDIDVIVVIAATLILFSPLGRHLGMPVTHTKVAHWALMSGIAVGPVGLIVLFELTAQKVEKCVADRALLQREKQRKAKLNSLNSDSYLDRPGEVAKWLEDNSTPEYIASIRTQIS